MLCFQKSDKIKSQHLQIIIKNPTEQHVTISVRLSFVDIYL